MTVPPADQATARLAEWMGALARGAGDWRVDDWDDWLHHCQHESMESFRISTLIVGDRPLDLALRWVDWPASERRAAATPERHREQGQVHGRPMRADAVATFGTPSGVANVSTGPFKLMERFPVMVGSRALCARSALGPR